MEVEINGRRLLLPTMAFNNCLQKVFRETWDEFRKALRIYVSEDFEPKKGAYKKEVNKAMSVEKELKEASKDKSMPLDYEEIKKMRFRVACLNPILDIEDPLGSIPLQSKINHICGYGHGMTIKEMNDNQIWEGKPYIQIPYCKYCYTEETVGVLDDDPRPLGWHILKPGDPEEDGEATKFKLVKLPKDALKRIREKEFGYDA